MKSLKFLSIFIIKACMCLHAQDKNPLAQKEAQKTFDLYIKAFADIRKNKTNKKAIGDFGKLFESGDVRVAHDFDSVDNQIITVRAYLPQISAFDTITRFDFKIISFSKIMEKPMRNCDEISILYQVDKVRKSYILDSSNQKIDSSESRKSLKRTMYLRLDENFAGDFTSRIAAITMAGGSPTYIPSPEKIDWWINLSDDWKKILKEKNALKKYPTSKDIDNLAFTFDIDLSKTQITDLSPLRKIKELRKLNISGTQISDISALDSCTKLGELNISNTKVRDIGPLANLKSMKKLFMNNIELKDINVLSNMTKLVELEASDNQINDISPLKNLENLEKLNLCVNKIFKLDALKNLIKLSDLRLGKNQIEGIEALSQLSELIRLDLFNNQIPSLVPIQNHVKIAFLWIDFNPIKDLGPLSRFGYLNHLSMSHTPIMDLGPISRSTTMGYLDISGSEVSSLAPVDKFNVIKEFKMFHTKISKNEAARYAKNHPGCKITYY